METGIIVEFIDQEKITCAVVQEVKNQRLRLLTETNREVNLSINRLSHKSDKILDPVMGRNRIVDALKEIASRRRELTRQVNIREIWEILNTEQEWIDLPTMTVFCFSNTVTCDHESAVVRAFFQNRTYFKFDHNRFFPVSEDQVERFMSAEREKARLNRLVEFAGNWLKNGCGKVRTTPLTDDEAEILEILRSVYLFGNDSPHAGRGKAILSQAGMADTDKLFDILVQNGIFHKNENLDLLRFQIPVSFSVQTEHHAKSLIDRFQIIDFGNRTDLTSLPIMTIDGQSTLDYDDAISFEKRCDHFRVGVHIIDVGHYIQKGDPIDIEAQTRCSSIYMPDQKISMIPSVLSEGLCSLRAGENRPAISIMMDLSRNAELLRYEIIPSVIRVKHQLSYYDVNQMADSDETIMSLHDLAGKFRQKRIENGAVHISLPDISVWLSETGDVVINRINRESPGRMLVAEMMILANWTMAQFLSENRIPAIYRSQPNPRDRLYRGNEGSLFQNYMQRKLLSRFIIRSDPERHSGLGLTAYVTATSPIRKYYDLITQRQIRSILGLEAPYSTAEIDRLVQILQEPVSHVSKIQYHRNRYWILKYLESRIGQKEEAIVLCKRRNGYLILMPDYMLECELPATSGMELKPENTIHVTIQHVSARKDILSVFL
ncbi:MAG: ribonuclease catalytic domain-containing protein [Desulfatirhabdiaceae bacterium]